MRLSNGTYAQLFPRMFTRRHSGQYEKSPEYVTPQNVLYRKMLAFLARYSETVASIDVFIGKKSSGGVEMIARLCEDLPEHIPKIFWIVCHHDVQAKRKVLVQYGIAVQNNPMVYYITDGMHSCREEYVFLGRLAME